MAVFAEIGGPGEVAAAGLRRFRAVAERAHGAARAAGDALVRMLARDILALGAEIEELQSLMAAELGSDETYRCLLTVPGIGPKTAAALVAGVDISLSPSCDKFASYCGVAPADSQSGTSVRSTRPQRGRNKPLKNLLIFSCNSLIGTKNRFGRHYDECRARKMRHNAALKTVARKRLRVIYSIMRDPGPYKEPAA